MRLAPGFRDAAAFEELCRGLISAAYPLRDGHDPRLLRASLEGRRLAAEPMRPETIRRTVRTETPSRTAADSSV
ncbi:hypothetical protein Q5425_36040 [Amycolatopsis sp. A133]|uniref:hypothetical protein n=1 Tax=Amycolatopsis sp. A133 TaxID=3064472 RepID=UPI0027E82AE0|nr:hypothetical protein [Amycolatopsis sp. A133]MDQ7809167.1 hypothetical protein [Amycolatopsis sp. A133]